MPGAMTLSFVILRLRGVPAPIPQFSVGTVLALCAVFFLAALGEELGWSGYVIGPMQERWGALNAALLLGALQVLHHSVAGRVIRVWLYNNTGRASSAWRSIPC